jgi:hypothetical protein
LCSIANTSVSDTHSCEGYKFIANGEEVHSWLAPFQIEPTDSNSGLSSVKLADFDASRWSILVSIDSVCELERFRRFMIMSTCQSYIPLEFDQDETVYPERSSETGTMYVEAEDKETVGQTREIRFTRVSNVLGIIYNSKSGRTQLKWRNLKGRLGRLSGEASPNTLVNLFASQALPESYAINEREQEQKPSQQEKSLNEAFADT